MLATEVIIPHNPPPAFPSLLQNETNDVTAVITLQTGIKVHQTKFEKVLNRSQMMMHIVDHRSVFHMDQPDSSNNPYRK